MEISFNWLKNYIPEFEIANVESLKYKLDTRLSEVDKVIIKGEGLSNLVIAHVIDVQPHPTNSHLHVCEVETGEAAHRTIVCGAPNARAGMKTVACLPGGRVYNPKNQSELVDIGERKMGEVMSAGMLCSPAELGLGSEHNGIIELPENSKTGTPIAQSLRDIIIEIENKNLAHRPDAFSHLGIAREISAIFKTNFSQREIGWPHVTAEEKDNYKISVQESAACARYSGISIRGITVGPSPLWLQIAVSYAGLRSINNIVDITNYVMLDVGQPLHAFDADKLAGKEIIVRKSKANEQITTLDGEKRKLPTGTLVIADNKQSIAIAGIMGGEHTAVSTETKNVFLESANFEMYGIRRSSRALGLRTDASSRYEKGLDPAMTMAGLHKAVEMILDICGGELACEVEDIYPQPEPEKVVKFNLNAVKRLQGIELDKSKLIDLLSSINLQVLNPEKISADALIRADLNSDVEMLIPSYRRDIKAQEDILEEIARLYGYENVPLTLPKRDLAAPNRNKRVDTLNRIRKVLASTGFNEIYTYSMVGEQLFKDALMNTDSLLKVSSPISPELGYIRNQILPSLVSKIKQNLSRYESFGLFEVSRVALKQKQQDGLPVQPYHMVAAFIGDNAMDTYRYLRQALDNLNNEVCDNKIVLSTTKGRGDIASYLHPGKYANLEFNGEVVGSVGMLHPLAISNFDLKAKEVAVMEIELDKILDMQHTNENFKSLSNYQLVIRDLSFWQGENTQIGDLIAAIKDSGLAIINSVKMLDIFVSKENKTSFTLRLALQAPDHTLTQTEIGEVIEKVVAISQKQGHQLRS